MADLWLPRNWCLLKAHTSRRKANLWSPLSEYRGNAEARQIRNSSLYLSLCFSLSFSLSITHTRICPFFLCAWQGWAEGLSWMQSGRNPLCIFMTLSLAVWLIAGYQVSKLKCTANTGPRTKAQLEFTSQITRRPHISFLLLLPVFSLSPSFSFALSLSKSRMTGYH